MRTSLLRILLFVAPLLVAGCSDLSGPDGARGDLDANRRRWESRGYATYQFTIRKLCFCFMTDALRATVVDDSVVSVVVVSTGAPVDVKFAPTTINDLFDFIEQGLANHSAVLDVTYDPDLGYPRTIVYDGAVNAADDEINFTVSNVDQLAARNASLGDRARRPGAPRIGSSGDASLLDAHRRSVALAQLTR